MKTAGIRLSGTMISQTPTFIGDGRRQTVERTMDYVPGSFIRGAFGIALIRTMCIKTEYVDEHQSCQARDGCPYFQLFRGDHKSSNIIFRNAYPEHVGCADKGIYLQSPKTLYHCDSLCGERFDSYETNCNCPKCFRPLEPYEGYVCTGCQHATKSPIKSMRMEMSSLIHESGGFGRQRSIEVIPPGTQFNLDIILASKAEPYVDLLPHILGEALSNYGIGRWKRMGFGRFVAKIMMREITKKMIEERAEEIDTTSFRIRLISPMILGEGELLNPSSLLESARRAYSRYFHEGKPNLPQVKLVEKRFSFRAYSGWSLKAQRRRRLMTAISEGSVFHFESDADDGNLALSLAALEYYAIGDYKPHGCGQIRVEP